MNRRIDFLSQSFWSTLSYLLKTPVKSERKIHLVYVDPLISVRSTSTFGNSRLDCGIRLPDRFDNWLENTGEALNSLRSSPENLFSIHVRKSSDHKRNLSEKAFKNILL